MQTHNATTKGRSRTSAMAEVNASSAERGVSGILEKGSEMADSNENHELPYNPTTSILAAEKCISQHGGVHQDQMLIPCCQTLNAAICESLQTANMLPPVTKTTLSELDLNWIMHNISLRVDVNFDHDLHFMPIQGPGTEQKRRDAKKYWLALATEFRIYQHNLSQCSSCQPVRRHVSTMFRPRLPDMFKTLRELLETLVPDKDHSRIAENLDVPLLMQEVENGVLDIVRLSQWIADLLKSHCAPMRDEWADKMASKIEEGCIHSDMEVIVTGLEKLFSFLEAMKLDVANHQIRTFRFPLIEDTVSFQQGYFGRRLGDQKFRPQASRSWYRQAHGDHQKCHSCNEQGSKFKPLGALIHGILWHCTQPQKMPELPDTFAYDRSRMNQIQEDVQDIIFLHICVHAFNSFTRSRFGKRMVRPRTYATLQRRITTIVENDNSGTRNDSWQAQTENVAMEITRAAYVECGHAHLPIPADDFEFTTRHLERAFRQNFSSLANELHETLEEMASTRALVFQDQSPLQISEAQKHWQQSRQENELWRADPEDIARRIAHIAVLHWRVWAALVYLKEDEDYMKEGESTIDDDNLPNMKDRLLLESTGEREVETDETPAMERISLVDEGGGDSP